MSAAPIARSQPSRRNSLNAALRQRRSFGPFHPGIHAPRQRTYAQRRCLADRRVSVKSCSARSASWQRSLVLLGQHGEVSVGEREPVRQLASELRCRSRLILARIQRRPSEGAHRKPRWAECCDETLSQFAITIGTKCPGQSAARQFSSSGSAQTFHSVSGIVSHALSRFSASLR